MSYAKSEETKKKLLKTTMRLLRTQGYNATGISQILAESGIPKGSLYHHFPKGKVELVVAAVEMANGSINLFYDRISASTASSAEAIQQYCDFFIREMSEGNWAKGCPIATVTLEAAAFVEPIQVACKAMFEDMFSFIELYLAKDGVPADVAEKLAMFVVAGIEGALVLSKAQRNTKPLELIRDSLIEQIESAIEQSKTEA